MQQNSRWQFQKLNLRDVFNTSMKGGTHAYIMKEPTLKEINHIHTFNLDTV